jgi:hypothetical protein
MSKTKTPREKKEAAYEKDHFTFTSGVKGTAQKVYCTGKIDASIREMA